MTANKRHSAESAGRPAGQIFLIGFSGSGKTTVGPILARRTGRQFVDLDDRISKAAGLPITEIFAQQGEKVFRDLEVWWLERLLRDSRKRLVVALGGGAFQSPRIRSLCREHGVVVYLSCSRREIYRRMRDLDDRPLLQVRPAADQTVRQARLHKISRMLISRQTGYRTADFTISTTDRTPAEAARRIARLVKEAL